jgi:hypothetical protein
VLELAASTPGEVFILLLFTLGNCFQNIPLSSGRVGLMGLGVGLPFLMRIGVLPVLFYKSDRPHGPWGWAA